MFQPYTLFAAVRYLRAKRHNRFASFVSLVSIVGIVFSVAALLIVLSVMNGFEREITRHVLAMTAHAEIVKPGTTIDEWHSLEQTISLDERVTASAPYIRGGAMVVHKNNVKGVIAEGIVPNREAQLNEIHRHLPTGAVDKLVDNVRHVLVGKTLAKHLEATSGDTVTLVIPTWDGAGNAMRPYYEQVVIAGVFEVGMHQFDSALVLMRIEDARDIFRLGNAISGLRLRFTQASIAPAAARSLADSLGSDLRAIDWTQYNRNFFLAIESQKRILFIILLLIVTIAAFNISTNMLMVVKEKMRDIAILRTMGATRSKIALLFLIQGAMIGAIGSFLGGLIGALGAIKSETVARFIERSLSIDLINSEIYFIDYLPAQLNPHDFTLVIVASLSLSIFATLYPALRAASIDPIQALHYD